MKHYFFSLFVAVSLNFGYIDKVLALGQEPVEIMFKNALSLLVSNDQQKIDAAFNTLIAQYPNFHPARMIYADILVMKAGYLPLLPTKSAQTKARIADLLEETKARYSYTFGQAEKQPDVILRLSPFYRYAMVFDATHSRLYLFKNGKDGLQLIKDYYASHGKGGMHKRSEGDRRTPTGVYKITQLYRDNKLPELYGQGAYTLDYPNRWDRVQGHSGSGIWLHGVPRITYSRPPLASRGCVVISNSAMAQLGQVEGIASAPIVLADRVDWLAKEDWLAQQRVLLTTIRSWQKDWQSLDVEKYLAHYSDSYRDENRNYRQMLAVTRRNAKEKTFIKVGIENIDLMVYSREPAPTLLIRFNQDYQSNNYVVAYRQATTVAIGKRWVENYL